MVGRCSEEVQKFEFLWRHLHGFVVVDDRIVCKVDGEVGVGHLLGIGSWLGGRSSLVTAQYRFDARDQLFGVKGFFQIVIGAEL